MQFGGDGIGGTYPFDPSPATFLYPQSRSPTNFSLANLSTRKKRTRMTIRTKMRTRIRMQTRMKMGTRMRMKARMTMRTRMRMKMGTRMRAW